MVKKKFWPFAIYKWSCDWPGPKERCSNLYEARLTKCLCWGDAYWCCRDDIEYIDKHEERFYNRRKGTYRFLVLMSIAVILVELAITIFCKKWLFLPFTVMMMLALLEFTVIFLAIRIIYYRGVEFDLCHANNRIDALTQVWPDIVNIVYNNMSNGYTDLPPEPRKTPGMTDEIGTISMLLERGS